MHFERSWGVVVLRLHVRMRLEVWVIIGKLGLETLLLILPSILIWECLVVYFLKPKEITLTLRKLFTCYHQLIKIETIPYCVFRRFYFWSIRKLYHWLRLHLMLYYEVSLFYISAWVRFIGKWVILILFGRLKMIMCWAQGGFMSTIWRKYFLSLRSYQTFRGNYSFWRHLRFCLHKFLWREYRNSRSALIIGCLPLFLAPLCKIFEKCLSFGRFLLFLLKRVPLWKSAS